MVFGESAADDFFQLGQLMQYKRQMLSFNGARRDQMLEEVKAGKVNQWIPDLLPLLKDYEAIQDSVLDALAQGYAKAAGEGRRWGVKLPEWYPMNLAFWQQRLPASRTVYIVRDVEECVASAKKMGMISAPEDEQFFRNNHQQFKATAQQLLRPSQTYFLDYANLCDEGAAGELVKLAAFLGLSSLPEEVLQYRVGDY